MRKSLILLVLMAGSTAGATDRTTNPYPGVQHLHRTTGDPMVIDAVIIDTTYVDLSVRATGSADRGHTVSSFASSYGVQVAWNGDLFNPLDFQPEGFAFGGPVGSEAVWPGVESRTEKAFVYFARSDVNEVGFYDGAAGTDPPPPQASWVGAVGGRPVVVAGGVPLTSFDCNDAEVDPCTPQPRTAIGVSMRQNMAPRYLYVAVVSGRTAQSRGMRMDELAEFMAELGAFDALALDGGSSSELYIRNEMGVVSQLPDGVERLVANQVGVRYDPSPTTYTLEGRVSDINDVTIVGAQVVRDDGVTVTTTSAPAGIDNYTFSGDPIPARYVCITVHKTGYRTAGACKEINPAGGTISYLNVRMQTGTDPPDASATDAPPRPDAAALPDASVDAPIRRDGGGNQLVGDDGCTCNVSGRGQAPWALLLLAGLVVRRKR